MKNKYNIKRSPQTLSDKEIEKHKDFDSLLKQYQAAASPSPLPIIKYLWYAGSAIAAAAIGIFLFININQDNNNYEVLATTYFNTKPYVNPPIKTADIAYEKTTINANEGGIIKYENGSQLAIPAAAFVSQKGTQVEGEVEIHYREFHDFVDFFVSGIPMEYDSAGTRYQLESAGMVEIFALKNNEKVSLAPNKPLQIELASSIALDQNEQVPSFNIYKLDTEKRNWVYEGKDNIEWINDPKNTIDDHPNTNKIVDFEQLLQSDLAVIEATNPLPPKPIKPQKVRDGAITFELDFDFEDFDESKLSSEEASIRSAENEIASLEEKYEKIIWEVAPNQAEFNKNVDKIIWEDYQIKKMNNNDYELMLKVGNKTIKVIIQPVLTGKDFALATATFEAEFEQYQQALSERENQLAAAKKIWNDRIEAEKLAAAGQVDDAIVNLKNKGYNRQANETLIKHKIINRFRVSSLGIWNCDRPLPIYANSVKGTLIDQNQHNFDKHTAYLVDKSRNTVQKIYTGKGCAVRYNTKSDNLMWVLTEDNKIAVFEPQDFKKIQASNASYTFNMKRIEQPLETEEDIRRVLEL